MFLRTRMSSILLATACLAAGTPGAYAQKGDAAGFPSRPIRVIVPFTPGGQPDIVSRMIAQKVGDAVGQSMIVDNRPGAGGMVGSRIVAEANPDGHTLLSISAAHTIGPAVRKLPYDTRKDFAGVSMAYNAAYLLVVPPALAKTTQELIALAKSKPGQLNMASAGRGSGTHFAGEVFKHAAGINVVHVPYKGIPEATNDIIAGRVQLFMAPLASSVPLIRDGRIRALGVSSSRRIGVLPDVPTIAESGLPGFRWDSWGAIFAPSRTPRAIINRLNREITAALRQPDVVKRMRALGAEPTPTTPAELDQFVVKDLAMVQKIATIAGIKPE
ncbi:MAG TPA: tripartite tricarboxylate transporter substrate binding protein [Burkholderiales bacterium]|nr:tripartite tricarboxylate transporter substrate binding protein [Burkholderiales bacterium]